MIYISWAAFYEGESDRQYFDIIIPRVIEELILNYGRQDADVPSVPVSVLGKRSRQVEDVAREACEIKDAAYLIFIHADTGGRGVEQGIINRSTPYVDKICDLCAFNRTRCVLLLPRHETEAWALSDPDALADSLGYKGDIFKLGAPLDASRAESETDPKKALSLLISNAQGRRRTGGQHILASIAQSQRIDRLRGSSSFRDFEVRLKSALQTMGVIY